MGLLCSDNYTIEERDNMTSRVIGSFFAGYNILMKDTKYY